MAWEDKVIENYPDPRKFLWEILVPTERRIKSPKPEIPEGTMFPADHLAMWRIENSYKTRYHRVWDEKVRKITGGLTIMQPVRGEWMSSTDELYRERNIPVRIMCTRAEINLIIDMTLVYYDQLAVMAYRVSDEVILRNRTE